MSTQVSTGKYAVGDLFADAGQFKQTGFCRKVGEMLGFLEPAGAGGEESRGLRNVPGPKSKQTSAKIFFGNGGEFRPGGEAVRR